MSDHPTWDEEDMRRTREEWQLGEYSTPEAETQRQREKIEASAIYGVAGRRKYDISLSQLVTKTFHPGTSDRERYARTQRENVRNERIRFDAYRSIFHVAPQDLAAVDMAFDSLLRTISRTDDIDTNRRRIMVALDVLRHVVDQFEWRARPFFVYDQETMTEHKRTPEHLRYDGRTVICTCKVAPEDVCSALIHTDLI